MIKLPVVELSSTRQRRWWAPALLPALAGVAVLAMLLTVVALSAPSTPETGIVEDGWTQVGGGTRLQYVDLAECVRCYRMRDSNRLECLRLDR
jgi:hypothetical protein